MTDYNMTLELNSNFQNSGEIFEEDVTLGDIEEVLSNYGDIESVEINEVNEEKNFVVQMEEFTLVVSPSNINTGLDSEKEKLQDLAELISELARLYRKKTDKSLEFEGELSLSRQFDLEPDNLFSELSKSVEDWGDSIAISYRVEDEEFDYNVNIFRRQEGIKLMVVSKIVDIAKNPEKENQRHLHEIVDEQMGFLENAKQKLADAS